MSGTGLGIFTAGESGSDAVEAQGLDAVPTTGSEAFGANAGSAFARNISTRFTHALFAGDVPGFDPVTGQQVYDPDARPMLSPEDANQRFGAPGLKFDKPIAEQTAQSLSDSHHDEAVRQDIAARAGPGLANSMLGRGATALAMGLLDPLNLAAGLIPGIGEARLGSIVAGVGIDLAASTAARVGVRAVAGATQGAAAMTALEPLNYALDRREREDWSMGEAMRNIAFGAALGGILHPIAGAVMDRTTGRYSNPVAQRMAEAGPETQDMALRGSLAQIAEGRPVDIAPAVELAEATKAQQDLARFAAVQQRIDAVAARPEVGDVPADFAGQASETQSRLTGLNADAEQMRGEIAGSRQQIARAGMDPETRDRLEQVEHELAGTLPKARRADLVAERTMLMEGRPESDAAGTLEAARSQAQIEGTQAGLTRTEQQIADTEKQLAGIRERAAADDAEAQARRQSADRGDRIRQAKQDSQQSVLQAMTERSLRRYAGGIGADVEAADLAAFAKDIRTAGPGEVQDTINHALSSIAAQRPHGGELQIGESPTAALAQHAADATAALRESAAKPNTYPVGPDAGRVARETIERGPKAPDETGIDKASVAVKKELDETVKQLEGEIEAGRLTEADASGYRAAEDYAVAQDAEAKAIEQATACIASRIA